MWQCLDLYVSLVCCLHREYFVAFFCGGGGEGGGGGWVFCSCRFVLFSFLFVRVCFFFLLLFVLSVCLVLFVNCFV